MTVVQQHSKLPVHLSTQASCLNVHAAKAWKRLGAKRLVLGREVSLEEAGKIRKASGIEVELFVHGAMCSRHILETAQSQIIPPDETVTVEDVSRAADFTIQRYRIVMLKNILILKILQSPT